MPCTLSVLNEESDFIVSMKGKSPFSWMWDWRLVLALLFLSQLWWRLILLLCVLLPTLLVKKKKMDIWKRLALCRRVSLPPKDFSNFMTRCPVLISHLFSPSLPHVHLSPSIRVSLPCSARGLLQLPSHQTAAIWTEGVFITSKSSILRKKSNWCVRVLVVRWRCVLACVRCLCVDSWLSLSLSGPKECKDC